LDAAFHATNGRKIVRRCQLSRQRKKRKPVAEKCVFPAKRDGGYPAKPNNESRMNLMGVAPERSVIHNGSPKASGVEARSPKFTECASHRRTGFGYVTVIDYYAGHKSTAFFFMKAIAERCICGDQFDGFGRLGHDLSKSHIVSGDFEVLWLWRNLREGVDVAGAVPWNATACWPILGHVLGSK
jgi:hypothetical protein